MTPRRTLRQRPWTALTAPPAQRASSWITSLGCELVGCRQKAARLRSDRRFSPGLLKPLRLDSVANEEAAPLWPRRRTDLRLVMRGDRLRTCLSPMLECAGFGTQIQLPTLFDQQVTFKTWTCNPPACNAAFDCQHTIKRLHLAIPHAYKQ